MNKILVLKFTKQENSFTLHDFSVTFQDSRTINGNPGVGSSMIATSQSDVVVESSAVPAIHFNSNNTIKVYTRGCNRAKDNVAYGIFISMNALKPFFNKLQLKERPWIRF
jgi:hypothetical protein